MGQLQLGAIDPQCCYYLLRKWFEQFSSYWNGSTHKNDSTVLFARNHWRFESQANAIFFY